MSVQLEALADEVFAAAAALDLVLPPDVRTAAAAGPGVAAATDAPETRVAMVQVFAPDLRTVVRSPLAGEGEAGELSIFSVRDEDGWGAFERLIRGDTAEQKRPDDLTAQLIALYRWRAANTPQRFYLAYQGNRAVAHVGLFQHRSSGYLHALFTRPDFRRRGAGSFLTLAMDSEARALGCERVVLQCTRDSRLPVYFQRLGFRAVGKQVWTKPLPT